MRIAIDLQGLQSEGSRKRGIGRYSFEIISSLLKYHHTNEYILVGNSALKDVRKEFSSHLNTAQNISYVSWYSPTPLSFISHKPINIELGKCLRSYTFDCLHADVIIVTSFLEGFSDNCLTEFDHELLETPVISIFYDLIPLLNRDLYLNLNPEFSKYYYRKLDLIKNFDALLAISKSSSEEAFKYLNIEQSKIFNISSACDTNLFNSSKNISHNLSEFFESISSYLLYSGAGDPRKNIKNLLKAYSLLPVELKDKYHLVLVGKLIPEEIRIINNLIESLNIPQDHIHMLGYVSDMDLVALYRNCSLFIFPSFHEGFGLPVLEAMNCGAPVIGSFSTSIPEIISRADAMFDPYDPSNIRDLIQRSIQDERFLSDLKSNSLKQSKKFSWLHTVNNLINACSIIINEHPKKSVTNQWERIREENTRLLANLINKLQITIKDDHQLIKIIASSIDKINLGLSSYLRKISFQKSINSWKVEGPFDSNYSLAILNRSFSSSLDEQIDNSFIHITEGGGDYDVDTDFLSNFSNLFSKYLISQNKIIISDVISRNLYPPRVSDLNARINLLHAYGWEESELPKKWINDFNMYLQGITVMSAQVKKILIDNGVRIPIKVCGLGINHFKNNSSFSSINIKAKKYKFLHISSCFPRKGVDILLKSYFDNFTKNDDVTLIIKTFENIHNNVDDLVLKYTENHALAPDVLILKTDLNELEINYLYSICDVLVAPSRGEGFGLPIAEAMSFGLPVITTGWGGQLDFCNQFNSFLIDFEFVSSQSHFGLDLSYWAEPSQKHLGELMFLLYKSGPSFTREKIDLAKQTISKFLWERVVNQNILFAQQLNIDAFDYSQTIGWMSSWNSKCGIASYSKHLISNLDEEVIVFSPELENKLPKEKLQVIPCWKLDSKDNDNFDLILSNLTNLKITTLIIQFNYGFFNFSNFSNFIRKTLTLDINLVIFFHSTADPIHDQEKKLIYLLDVLRNVDRIFVHTIADLNRLKNIGLVNNVTLFPHGILDYKINLPDYKKNNILERLKPRKIASYGFLLPHKGILQLIEAINILRNQKFIVHLNLINSIYSDDYLYFYDEVVQLISTLKLSKLVTLQTDYLSDEDSLNLLSMNDLIVFPYQNTQESSSAAVRHGLATGRPVLVTPLDIFEDVSNIVNFTSGISPKEIATCIRKWYELNDFGSNMQDRNTRIKIIKERSFSKLGQRLSSIIQGLYVNKAN